MAALAAGGLAGSTRMQKSINRTIFNPTPSISLGILNKRSNGALNQYGKNWKKFDHYNTSLHLLVCGVLLLVPALSTCNTPGTADKAQYCVDNIADDPFGILLGRTQLNFLGYGSIAIFAQVLRDGRAQIPKSPYKTTLRRMNESWRTRHTAKILLLLLLLSGDVHLNPGPIFQQAQCLATTNDITPTQILSPVIELIQPASAPVLQPTPWAPVLPGGVCVDGVGTGAASGGRAVKVASHRLYGLEEARTGEQIHSAAVAGVNPPDSQEPTCAMEAAMLTRQQAPRGSAIDSALCHLAQTFPNSRMPWPT